MATHTRARPKGRSPRELVLQAAQYYAKKNLDQTRKFCRKALKKHPRLFDALHLLGNAESDAGNQERARELLQRAIEVDPDKADAHNNLGCVLRVLGLSEEALASYEMALELAPGHASAGNNMGNVLTDMGRVEEAIEAYHRAIANNPMDRLAHFNLFISEFHDGDLKRAAATLQRSLQVNPTHSDSQFYLGMVLDKLGDRRAAARHFERVAPRHRSYLDSWEYVVSVLTPSVRLFGPTCHTLWYALDCATLEGLTMEFGVRHGTTLRFIAQRTSQPVDGFDSFEGLPEDWYSQGKGAYTTHSTLPEVPPHVRLHVGWFDNTLAEFVRQHDGPVRFLHVDCDLYSSTRTIFEHLADRIVPGTVILFDEYLMNTRWREDEFRGFQEAVALHGWRYEYIAFSLPSKQAAVRIL